MQILKHFAIYISAEENVNRLADLIMQGKVFGFAAGLETKKGALFSTIAIRQFVQEELIHGHFEIATKNNHSLATSSSGEQRNALLQHILSSNPDYIIVDNVFESLDAGNQQHIIKRLTNIADNTVIIQILHRKNDCLLFINSVFIIKNETILLEQIRAEFLQPKAEHPAIIGTVPVPILEYAATKDALIKMDNVCVAFNERPVLSNICWQINPDEFWQLSGPNGSGKSTLLSMIIGDSVKGYGQDIYLFGKKKGSGESVWDIKKKIGYFTSSITPEFPRQDSIEKMIISGFWDSVGLYIQPTELQLKLARQWIQLIGLSDLKNKPFRFLTLAQQRMVLITRAMVKHPPLLILDEPTAGLDDENALLFTCLVNKIATETNSAIIYVSHRTEAGLLPDKIFELIPSLNGSSGKIIIKK